MATASGRPTAAPRPPGPAPRTYVVLAIGGAAGLLEYARPLGTIAATRRSLARDAARALHPDVSAGELRVLAAGNVPTELLTRALAIDGRGLVAEG